MLSHGMGGEGGGGGGGAFGLAMMVHMLERCCCTSARLLPMYEYVDAGDDAIEFRVAVLELPKPTAMTVVPEALTVSAVVIAPASPPYSRVCSPSVSSRIICSTLPYAAAPVRGVSGTTETVKR
eukprot:968926-Prymnesium_polylepis.1